MSRIKMELSVRDLVSRTLNFEQLEILGLSNEEISILFPLGVRCKKITIESLRTSDTGLHIRKDKLLELVSPEVKGEVTELFAKKNIVEITGNLLEVSRLELVDLVRYVQNIPQLLENFYLEYNELSKLVPFLDKKYFTKILTLNFVFANDEYAGIRAQLCPLLSRCLTVAEQETKTSMRHFSCAECILYRKEREKIADQMAAKTAESFGVAPYAAGWPSSGGKTRDVRRT